MTSAAWRVRRTILLAAAAIFVGLFLLSPGAALGDSSGEGISATILVSDAQLAIELDVQPDGDIEQGRTFRVTADITNTGSSALDLGEAALFVDVSGLRILSPDVAMLPHLRAGNSRSVRWTIRAEEVGLYVITVEAVAQDETDSTVLGDANETLRVVERSRPGPPSVALE